MQSIYNEQYIIFYIAYLFRFIITVFLDMRKYITDIDPF